MLLGGAWEGFINVLEPQVTIWEQWIGRDVLALPFKSLSNPCKLHCRGACLPGSYIFKLSVWSGRRHLSQIDTSSSDLYMTILAYVVPEPTSAFPWTLKHPDSHGIYSMATFCSQALLATRMQKIAMSWLFSSPHLITGLHKMVQQCFVSTCWPKAQLSWWSNCVTCPRSLFPQAEVKMLSLEREIQGI